MKAGHFFCFPKILDQKNEGEGEAFFLLTKNPGQEKMKVRHFFCLPKNLDNKKMKVRHVFA